MGHVVNHPAVADELAGWLYPTNRDLVDDAPRGDRTRAQASPRRGEDAEREPSPLEEHFADEIGDEPFRPLFLCCHDAVPAQSRVAIALRTPGGFRTAQVAHASLTTDASIQKRNFRLGRQSAARRVWREALRSTEARADRELLRRRLAICRPDGSEPVVGSRRPGEIDAVEGGQRQEP